ncbi:MAG: hypothetical protein LBT61_04580 [Prevotellaceae bacterium]|jgi:hypothetical protein|nr:hypothetical protein [Prevotellaceae bacterium]
MSKKWILLICFAVLVCLSGAFWLLTNQTEKQKAEANIISAVPFDALFIVQLDKLVLLNDNFAAPAAWNNLISGQSPLLAWIKKTISVINNDDAAALLLHSRTYLSAHPLGKNELSILCAMAFPPSINDNNWENIIGNIIQPASRTRYQESTIVSIQTDDGMLYLSYAKGIGMASSSLITIQSAIRHLKSGESLAHNEQFATAAQTIGRHVDIGFMLNHRQLPHLGNVAGNKIPSEKINFLAHTANWTALDGQITPNMITLNGFVFPSFTMDNYLSVLLNQSNSNTEAWDVLPASANFMLSLSIGDPDRFLNNYGGFLEAHKDLSKYKQRLAALEKEWPQNAPKLFCSLYPAEMALANLSSDNWVILLKTANAGYALEQLQAQAVHLNKNFIATRETAIDNSSITIYNNPAAGLFHAVLGDVFPEDQESFFTVSGDWFYFSGNKELLKQVGVRQHKNTLKKYLSQIEVSQYLTNNACLTIVARSPNKAEHALLQYFHPRVQRAVANTAQQFHANIQILQLQPSSDKLYASFLSLFDTNTGNSSSPEPAPAQTHDEEKPQAITPETAQGDERLRVPVINHYTKEKESFVQFADYRIGLQSKDGQWLWAKKLNSAIIGDVIQIDYLRNGKLQMLFTTPTHIYLYDRNGNLVTPYPVTWKTPASTMAVFDYDKDRNYRIFITDADNVVRVYDKRIQPVEGWKPFKSPHAVTRAPEFFRVASRDYIVLCSEQTMYIFDRKGNERVKLEKPVIVKPDTPITAQQQPALLKVTAADGKQALIYLKDGKVELK